MQPRKHAQYSKYITLVGNAKESPPTTCLPLAILVSYCLFKRTISPRLHSFPPTESECGQCQCWKIDAISMGLVELYFSLRWYQSLGFYYATDFHCGTSYLFL